MSKNYTGDGDIEANQGGQPQQYCVWLYHSEHFPDDPRPVSAFWPTVALADQRQTFYQESDRRNIMAEPGHEEIPMVEDRDYRVQHCGQYGYGCACRLYVAEHFEGNSISLEQPGNEIDWQAEWAEFEVEDDRNDAYIGWDKVEHTNDEAANYDLAEYDINAPYRAEKANMRKLLFRGSLLVSILVIFSGFGLVISSSKDNPQELYPPSNCPATFTIFGYQATDLRCNQESYVDNTGKHGWLVRLRFLIPSLDYSPQEYVLSGKIYQTKFLSLDDGKVYPVADPDIGGGYHDYIVVLAVPTVPRLKHFVWQIEPGNTLKLDIGVDPSPQ